MVRKVPCKVPDCDEWAHARGYCRRHYGQVWRNGRVLTKAEEEEQLRISSEHNYSLRALRTDYQRAKKYYDCIVGFHGRMRWRNELAEIEQIAETKGYTIDDLMVPCGVD